jgi:hypothetical protein
MEAEMEHPIRLRRAALVGSIAVGTVLTLSGVGMAGASATHRGHVHGAAARVQAWFKIAQQDSTSPVRDGGGDSDLMDQQDQYSFERTAPAGYVTGNALGNAVTQAATLDSIGGRWREFTNQPYNDQPSDFTDPFWSNIGAGFSIASGRATALTTTPDGAWFVGTADGGVWRSDDQGQHWTPVFDNMPTTSIGSLAVDPANGSLWVGTGEANTSGDSYAGTGVYRSGNDGNSWHLVGDGNPIANHTVFRVAFAPNGTAYAATNNGLFRMPAGSDSWTEVLDPSGPVDFPPYDQQVTDVAVQPGSGGQVVIAAIGWHGPGHTANNGFYQSTDSGNTFTLVTPTGDINASDIGRTTFAYSKDGSKLYAIVQSPAAQGAGAASVLQGIFSASGSPASVTGPWTLIADKTKLEASGSAFPAGPTPGVQTWYNQALAVDPSNPNHVYASLEEVYESTNGGSTWITASPYWNFNFACDFTNPPTCPNTTHPDQHALMITDGKVVIGNDGGVYSRPLSDDSADGNWSDLNATLHTLQYYDARAGKAANGDSIVWGGLQDNGSAIFDPAANQMVVPAGGDGFDVIIDPNNANNIAGEYVDGTMYTSTDGGHSFADFISPTCAAQAITGLPGGPRADCDPNARFWTPIVPDQTDVNTWLIGGEFVWVSHDGWNTACTNTACSWTPVYDNGPGRATTALASTGSGGTIYAAWVTGGGNPGPAFSSGIATNYGGTWHQINMTGLPNRFISGLTVDPSNPAHAYAVFGAYSRRWIPGAGVGHVFETHDGGQTWTNISGNLPDVPGDALVLSGGQLALGTDIGVFTAQAGQGAGTTWSVLGTGLPTVATNDLTAGPDGFIYDATHGRGVWRIRFPVGS